MADKRRRPLRWHLIWAVIFFFFAASVLSLFLSIPVFNIKNVRIEGAKILSRGRIIEGLEIKTGANIFFADYSKAKEFLSSIPQIRDYGIYRRFPHTVLVKIIERSPSAVLISGSETIVVDIEGYILKVSGGRPRSAAEEFVFIENIAELPVIRGISKDMIGEGEKLPQGTSRLISDAIGGLKLFLDPSSLQLELGRDGNITLFVQDVLTVRLGDLKEVSDKILVLRSLLPAIDGKWDKVKHIDIRYPGSPVIVFKK